MGLCLLISVGLIFLIKSYRKYLKYYIVLVGTLIILITPFYDIILNFIDAVVLRFWLLPPPPEAPFITLANFTLGYNALKVSYFAFAVVFLVLFIIGLFCLRHQKRKRFLVLSLFLPPLVGGYFISQQIPIYLDRQFLFISPVYYIIVALAISKIKYKIVRFVFIGFYCLAVINPLANYYNFNMPLGSYYHVGVYPKKPDKDVVNYLRENLKDGDIVAVSEPHAWRFEYYFDNYGCMSNSYFFFIDSLFKRNQPYYYNALKEIRREKVKHGFPLINLVNLEQNTSEIIAVPHISAYNFSRIWLISTSWGRDGKFPPHVVRVRNWLNYNWHKAKTRRFPGIIIDLYQKNKDCK
jgi:hypothetical protein